MPILASLSVVDSWLLVGFLTCAALLVVWCARARRHDRQPPSRLSDMTPPRDTVDVLLWESELVREQRDRADARAHMAGLRALHAQLEGPNVDASGRTRKVRTAWDDPKGAA